jgi:hypothetical protein
MPTLNSLLSAIVADVDLHARWLNTFSYLEYIGFRKIVKSQHSSAMDFETLSHAVEEGRHALLLKKLAMNTGGDRFEHYTAATMLCHEQAENYFQSLDSFCETKMETMAPVRRIRLTYLYVTWLIEIRALTVYDYYQAALNLKGERLPLGGLLAEEDRHLAAVERELKVSDPLFETRVVELKAFEQNLYQNYVSALANEISTKTVHA